MQQNNRNQFKALIDSAFYSDVMTLNFKPLDWVHPERLKEVKYIEQLTSFKNAKIQHYIAQQLNLENSQVIQFSDPLKRLIFLSNDKLMKLMNIVGLCCFQKQLKLLIEKRLKQQLEIKIGQRELAVVQKKSPLMIVEFPKPLQSDLPIKNMENDQPREFYPYGIQLLLLATEKYGSQWHRLLLHKFPVFDDGLCKNIELTKTERSRLRLLIQKIALETESECMNLVK